MFPLTFSFKGWTTVMLTKLNPVSLLQHQCYGPDLMQSLMKASEREEQQRLSPDGHHHCSHAVCCCSFCPCAWHTLGHRQQMGTLAPSGWRRTKRQKNNSSSMGEGTSEWTWSCPSFLSFIYRMKRGLSVKLC